MRLSRSEQQKRSPQPGRHGVVLIVVLVVIAMLTLAAYTFTESMLIEAEATAIASNTAQARRLAESGLDYAAAYLLSAAEGELVDFYDNPDLFQAVPVGTDEIAAGSFSLIAPAEWDTTYASVRYGLYNESNKLNLNTLVDAELSDVELQDRLLALPGMTIEIADCILDWLDEDDTPREYGAEYDYYTALPEPLMPRNGPLLSLDELLHIPGMTRELLYGRDTNANGILEPAELAAVSQSGLDEFPGLEMGWSRYLTIYSGESTLGPGLVPKIDVNQESLTDLFDAVEQAIGYEAAAFIVAFRLAGEAEGGSDQSSGGGGSGGDDDGGRGDESGGGAGGGQSGPSGEEGAAADAGEDASRAGMDLSNGGSVQITSLYQLIGAEASPDTGGEEETLRSPWQNTPEMLTEEWPLVLQMLTTTSDTSLPGRVNVNTAPREVLLSIPGLDEITVDSILAVREASAGALEGIYSTNGWLLAENLVELSEMRELDRYLTGGGEVYRVQSVGFFDADGVSVRLEAVLDATELPPRLRFQRELTHLGRGYSSDVLRMSESGITP